MPVFLQRLPAIALCLIVGTGVIDGLLRQQASLAIDAPHAPIVEAAEDQWTLLAAGDVMLSRYVKKMIDDNGIDYPFEHIRPIVDDADIAFANLENPVGPGKDMPYTGLRFRATPGTLTGLKNAGFDVLSLANNHQSDNGRENIPTTVDFVKRAGFAAMGAGANEDEARTPAALETHGMSVAFLAYGDPRFVNQVHFASSAKAGIAEADPQVMKEDVQHARANGADVVVISLHAGTEYRETPDAIQRDLLEAAADAGADVVLGHHPHVIQPLWKRGNTWIIASLGNLVFDQDHTDDVKRGMMLRFTFEGSTIVMIEPIPVVIENYAQPRLAEGKEKDAAIKRLHISELGADSVFVGE